MGLGFQPERGPGHEGLRVMNILGTGACNSDCLFCCEKFNPSNRLMPSADATRQMILDGAGEFDMLFLASGEPTIHPKLFDYVELAKSVGFTSFGMSSHFRTFADPRFALKTLQAGFEFFDISLHTADAAAQLDVNPIDDGGQSLFEALKGLANMYRLADALGIRISITQKIVISRLNVNRLEDIFRATYDRGVRHFILQPVRTLGLAPERQAALAISEDEILPHLNEMLRKTQGLSVVLKPYGLSRGGLVAGEHVEYERNRIKNISGKPKAKRPRGHVALPRHQEPRPTDGRHWVDLRTASGDQWGFASDGSAPVLDQALRHAAQLPFGCRMGSCGMCCGVLLDGRVDQSTQHFLSDEQMRQGYMLLCQARPLSDVTVRLCTDDEIDPL
jgi:2Fe-2S type ferredoxin